jgi:hypothetical protein
VSFQRNLIKQKKELVGLNSAIRALVVVGGGAVSIFYDKSAKEKLTKGFNCFGR